MIKMLRNCFDKEPVNLGRQRELDVAKGIFIIFMSWSHSIEILGWFFDPNSSVGDSWHNFDMVIKSMILVVISGMGISLCYSSRRSAESLFQRALGMLGVVALLEFSRTIIPCFIEWLIFRDFKSIRYAFQFLSVDILQFVTLAFSVVALFKKLKLKLMTMILISAVLSVIGQLLQGVTTGSFIGDIAVGYLWHSHYEAYFPLLNWLFAFVIGYAFGHAYPHLRDKDTFYKIVTPIGIVISVLYFVSMVVVGKWYYLSGGVYCGIGLLDILFMFIVFIWITGICYFLSKWAPRGTRWLEKMGIRITSIYCIHWIIYAFLYLILTCVMGDNFVPGWAVVPTALLVVIVADPLSYLYKKLEHKILLRKNG